MKTKHLFLFALLCCTTLVYSCKKDDDNNNNNNNNNNSTNGETRIQFVNAAPEHQPVDIYPNGASSPTLVGAYYQFGSDYGRYDFTDNTVTFGLSGYSGSILSANLHCQANKTYTFFLYDSMTAVHYLYIADTVPTSTAAGKGAVKFVNVALGSGPLTYRVKGGATLTTNVQYAGSDSLHCYTAFLPVDTGYLPLEILDANTQQVIDSVSQYVIHITQGESYTIFTSGYRGSTTYPDQLSTFWTKDEIVQ